MKQKRFLILFIVLLVGLVGYFSLVRKKEPVPGLSLNNKIYTLPLCGVTVVVKTVDLVKTDISNNTGARQGRIIVGKDMPDSDLEISCVKKREKPTTETEKLMNDISYFLSIQSSGSVKIRKDSYAVFDKQTLMNIKDLYSAKDRGYREGSETIGFSNESWIYTFSFLNPAEDKNQDNYIISVGI